MTIIHLGPASPRASSDATRKLGRAVLKRFPIPPCSGWGLPCDPCYQGPGELLPHPFTLTARSRGRARRFALCCTILGVTPTRRYLASCPAELGLSSRSQMVTGDRLDRFDPALIDLGPEPGKPASQSWSEGPRTIPSGRDHAFPRRDNFPCYFRLWRGFDRGRGRGPGRGTGRPS